MSVWLYFSTVKLILLIKNYSNYAISICFYSDYFLKY